MNINKNINILANALGAYSTRQQLLSNNIANANTPNYKRKDIKFEEILKNSTKNSNVAGYVTDKNHIQINNFKNNIKIHTDKTTRTRLDGNNVDIDVEMAELSKNSINYNTITQQINSSFRRLRYAITEGRR
ncbi:flagellar basal body rod protein FlgB [Alkalithermobacter paradoxus]|uniref:Flagellar basal body rod protein FlgB n=1 Tax=Alkalithermobacter paradoxus TaxID=29349 RepID=A0A1V4IB31_9FIRM|nr:flagellar basal body rod protein FlgB [[Clostridium] thermoalcaliphilum]